jgi:hypothetical protein
MTKFRVLIKKHNEKAEWYTIGANNYVGARKEGERKGKVLQIDEMEEKEEYKNICGKW